jgi:hypothetical protein
MQSITANMHTLTRAAINDLQNAFQVCDTYPADGLILSALVKIRSIQDLLPGIENTGSDNNPDGYYRAA